MLYGTLEGSCVCMYMSKTGPSKLYGLCCRVRGSMMRKQEWDLLIDGKVSDSQD